jgi:hypothetical protein
MGEKLPDFSTERKVVFHRKKRTLALKYKLTAVGVGAGFKLWWALLLQRRHGGSNDDGGQWRTICGR